MGVGGFASTRLSLKETITSRDKQLRNAFEQQVREPEPPSRMGAGDGIRTTALCFLQDYSLRNLP